MADSTMPTRGAQLPPVQVRRRAVLATAAGASAAFLTGVRSATAEPAPFKKPAAAEGRRIAYHSFTGAAFSGGQHDGTMATSDGLWFDSATGSLAYADPYATDAASVDYESASWDSPVIQTEFAYTELIASWRAETPGGSWIEISVRGTDETGTVSGWFVLGRWCALDPADGGGIHRTSVTGQGTEVATVWTDTLHAYEPHQFTDWQLRIMLLRPAGSGDRPLLRQVSAVASRLPEVTKVEASAPGSAAGMVLDVPALSQEVHIGHYPGWDGGGEAWCSPTSTAMVLRYWGVGPEDAELQWVDPAVDGEVDHAARNVFDYAYDGAGNWPFNTAYAGQYGLNGFITRLRSLDEAEQLIKAGIPVIISVSFKKSKMDGAGYGTNGHLMVVIGFTADGDVVVNDPASHLIPDNDEVRVVYRRDQVENAWLPHSGGTSYIIHPPDVPLPPVAEPAEPNW